MESYIRLVDAIVKNPEAHIADLSMLSDEKRRRILIEWSGTRGPTGPDEPVHETIEARAQQTPDAPALAFAGRPDRRMTYRELNERANGLAHRLRRHEPGAIVGLCMERSFEMITGLLAIFKAGGVYLPLDPDYPVDRLKYIVKDASVRVTLTRGRTEKKIQSILVDEITVVNTT